MAADERIEYTVKVSYMEIYMEKIKDLLARTSAGPSSPCCSLSGVSEGNPVMGS
jgi:hypothetical protein